MRIDSIEHAIFGKAQPALWVLMAAVGLLLLAACVNAGNLLLSRAMDRQGEMRLRAALGAGRGRVVRQMLAEGLPIGILGGAAGSLLARYGVAALVALAPADIPRIAQAQVSGTVLLYTWLLSLVTVLVFMLPAALHASRVAPLGSTPARRRTRGLFVTAQVAVSVMLIIGAITLARGFARTQPHRPRLPSRSRTHLPHHALQARVRRAGSAQAVLRPAPGAPARAPRRAVPPPPFCCGRFPAPSAGTPSSPSKARPPPNRPPIPSPNYEAISPDYFRTMRIPMLAGRDFTPARPHRSRARRDRQRRPRAPLLARPECRRQAPQTRAPRRRAPWLTVVAVVADVRYREWETSRFDIYIPLEQRAQHRSDFVVRTSQDPLALSGEIQRAVAAIDKDQPVSSLTTVDSLVAETFALPRFNLTLLALFAGCALALAMAGVFALLMHSVTQRLHEIGIRIALGARRADVLRLVILDGIAWTALGIVCGVLAATAAGPRAIGTPRRHAPARCPHHPRRRIRHPAGSDRRQPPARPPSLASRPHPSPSPRVRRWETCSLTQSRLRLAIADCQSRAATVRERLLHTHFRNNA